MQFHPLSTGSFVYSGKGGGGLGDEIKGKREGSPLINLELKIGGIESQSCLIKKEEENLLFTAAQFQELYLQVVIFKYLSSGLPVPFHLVLPVWKSLFSSFGCGFPPQELVHRGIMDPEPGRCRRTDGKKWRCHGRVVPDQKYCPRHMHRGSQRSRKLVEASRDILKLNTEILNPDKSRSRTISSCSAITNCRSSVPISTSLDLTVPSAIVEVGSSSVSYNSNSEGSSPPSIVQVDSGAATSSLLKGQASKNSNGNESKRNDSPGLGLGLSHFTTGKSNWCNEGNKSSGKPSIAAGLSVPPRSVYQGGIGTGGSSLNVDNKTGVEAEELRCRRTDGKRWRCNRDVVPDKKYCENHLHRGAKRATLDSKSTTGAPRASSSRIAGTYIIPEQVKNCRNILNTNLSISIETTPVHQIVDSDDSSSSDSDATTISDENASVSPPMLTLSP